MGRKITKTKQKGIRLPLWMADAIEELAEKKGYTFTDVIVELLRKELEFEGRTMGIGRPSNYDKAPVADEPDS